MVYGKVCLFEDGSYFELVGSNLVVACLTWYAQFESLYLQVFHESLYALWNSSEVVVVHLLVLCRVVSHERTSRHHQVGSSRVEAFVNEEVFLFPSEVALHLLYVGIEIAAYLRSCHVDGM